MCRREGEPEVLQAEGGARDPWRQGTVWGLQTPDRTVISLMALVQSVIRRSWFLCSKWKNPSTAQGWGEVG
jgi:hypothetical protein